MGSALENNRVRGLHTFSLECIMYSVDGIPIHNHDSRVSFIGFELKIINHREKQNSMYYLYSAVCLNVRKDYSRTIQPKSLELGHNIPH